MRLPVSLTDEEIMRVLARAREKRLRDWVMILTTYLHGLRASETINLRESDVAEGRILVYRGKGSEPTDQALEEHDNPLLNERAAIEEWLNERARRGKKGGKRRAEVLRPPKEADLRASRGLHLLEVPRRVLERHRSADVGRAEAEMAEAERAVRGKKGGRPSVPRGTSPARPVRTNTSKILHSSQKVKFSSSRSAEREARMSSAERDRSRREPTGTAPTLGCTGFSRGTTLSHVTERHRRRAGDTHVAEATPASSGSDTGVAMGRHGCPRNKEEQDLLNKTKEQELLFPITRQRFWQIFREHAIAAGIPRGLKYRSKRKTHALKHSIAKHLVKDGMPLNELQMRLGWKSIKTAAIYTIPDQDEVSARFSKIMREKAAFRRELQPQLFDWPTNGRPN